MPVVPYPRNEPSSETAASAMNGANQLMSLTTLLSHPMVGYGSVTGDVAAGGLPGFSLVDHYLSVFDEGAKDIASKMGPASRAMFAQSATGMRDHLARGLLQHQDTQRQAVQARAQRARYAGPAAEGTAAFAPSPAAPQPAAPSPAPSGVPGPRSVPAGGGPPDGYDLGKAVEAAKKIAGLDSTLSRGKDLLKSGLPRLATKASGILAVGWEAFHADPAGAETSTYVFGPGRPSMPVRTWGHAEAEQRELQVRRNGIWQPISPLKRDKKGNGFRIVDPDRFARATGQKWDTIVEQTTKDPDIPKVGFAVTVNNEVERRILEDGRAAGKDARDIQEDIDNYRAGVVQSGGKGGDGFEPRLDVSRLFRIKKRGRDVEYEYMNSEHHGLALHLGSDGVLGFDVRAGKNTQELGSGTDMVLSAMKRIQSDGLEVKAIRGFWLPGTDSVNYAEYMKNLQTMDPRTAAANTWTGRLAAKLGYTIVGEPETRGTVKVLFTKPGIKK